MSPCISLSAFCFFVSFPFLSCSIFALESISSLCGFHCFTASAAILHFSIFPPFHRPSLCRFEPEGLKPSFIHLSSSLLFPILIHFPIGNFGFYLSEFSFVTALLCLSSATCFRQYATFFLAFKNS